MTYQDVIIELIIVNLVGLIVRDVEVQNYCCLKEKHFMYSDCCSYLFLCVHNFENPIMSCLPISHHLTIVGQKSSCASISQISH